MTKREQNKLAKEIFEMVYKWGTYHLVVDHKSPAYQTEIGRLLGNKFNGVHKIGTSYMDCYITECKKKHLPF